MAKKRYCLYLSRPLAHQLERVASLRHGSKSALLEEALRKSLEPEQVPGVEEGLVRRLNELHKALAAIARDVTVATETLALFVRYMLTVTPPIPDSDQESARLTGRGGRCGDHTARGRVMETRVQGFDRPGPLGHPAPTFSVLPEFQCPTPRISISTSPRSGTIPIPR